MKTRILTFIAVLFSSLILHPPAFSQVPGIINYQGRIVDGGTNFNGTGQFEFALVSGPVAGRQATATVQLSGGSIGSITVTDGGSGYTSPPTVTITDPLGNLGGCCATTAATVSNG